MTPDSSRRDFLKGKAAADAMAEVADRVAENLVGDDAAAGPLTEPLGDSYLVRISRKAMACEFELALNAGQYAEGTETGLDVLDQVDGLEEQMSVFRPTSQIGRVNQQAAEHPVEVEPPLFELLQAAMQFHAETDGAFDITSGPLWEAWGFSRRQGRIPSDSELAEVIERVGSHLVELDAERHTVRFQRPGVQLNLGGIGKGYALDRCAESLEAAGIHDYLFHGGQSSVLARGSRMSSADRPSVGWVIGLGHPQRRLRLAELRLRDRALGTSGSGRQFFRHQGRRYGHILDPRTGRPAEGVLSTTVLAPTARQADALATAFYVMGPEAAVAYCESRPELGVLLVCPASGRTGIELVTTGIDEDDLAVLNPW